jgi:hypothetical protein
MQYKCIFPQVENIRMVLLATVFSLEKVCFDLVEGMEQLLVAGLMRHGCGVGERRKIFESVHMHENPPILRHKIIFIVLITVITRGHSALVFSSRTSRT